MTNLKSESTSPTLQKSNAKVSDQTLPSRTSPSNKDTTMRDENTQTNGKTEKESTSQGTLGVQDKAAASFRESNVKETSIAGITNTSPVIIAQPVLPFVQGIIQQNTATPVLTSFIQTVPTVQMGYPNYIMTPSMQPGQNFYPAGMPQYGGLPMPGYPPGYPPQNPVSQQGIWYPDPQIAGMQAPLQEQHRYSNTQYHYNQSRFSDASGHHSIHGVTLNQGTQTSPTNQQNLSKQPYSFTQSQGYGASPGQDAFSGGRQPFQAGPGQPSNHLGQPTGNQMASELSQQSLVYATAQATPSFSQPMSQPSNQFGLQQTFHSNGKLRRQDQQVNIFKEESVNRDFGRQGGVDPRPSSQLNAFSKVYTDPTTAAYDNPGFPEGQLSSGVGSPAFKPTGAPIEVPREEIGSRPRGGFEFKPDSYREPSGLDMNLSASKADTSRMSMRPGQGTPGSVGRSSVAYETLLSRRKRELGSSSATGMKSIRFPRMKSKQFIYFDLDEVTFDKDKSGDNIRID